MDSPEGFIALSKDVTPMLPASLFSSLLSVSNIQLVAWRFAPIILLGLLLLVFYSLDLTILRKKPAYLVKRGPIRLVVHLIPLLLLSFLYNLPVTYLLFFGTLVTLAVIVLPAKLMVRRKIPLPFLLLGGVLLILSILYAKIIILTAIVIIALAIWFVLYTVKKRTP